MDLERTGATVIGVAPIGDVPSLDAEVVAGHVTGFLHLPCRVLPPSVEPDFAWDRTRLQYDAGRILDRFEQRRFGGHPKVICLLNLDLFVPVFTHVFGEARLGGRVALASLYRLAPEPGLPAERRLERTAKVALHELGHLFDLTHCSDAGCLMHFSGDCRTLDDTPLLLCRYCRRFLADARQGGRLQGSSRVRV